MAGIKGPKPIAARERVLDTHEIKAFWQAAGEMAWPFAAMFKVLLVTGARREEVAGMRWSELDLDAGIWTLPGVRTKNKREHRLALHPMTVALLDRVAIEEHKRQGK